MLYVIDILHKNAATTMWQHQIMHYVNIYRLDFINKNWSLLLSFL